MSSMTVRLTWDGDDLGPMWMNEDNLKALLYGKTRVREEALEVQVLDHTEWQLEYIVPEQVDEQPRSMNEIARMVEDRIHKDRETPRIDQFGFTIDSSEM